MTDLLPCPFCGCTAIYVTHTHYYDDEDTVCVFCNGCKAHVILEQNEAEGINEKTKAEAIAAWNTRAERTCRQEERGWGTEGDHARVWLTCGHDCMVPTVQDLPNYCPNCGAKVVEE